jgi:hypothetical protein
VNAVAVWCVVALGLLVFAGGWVVSGARFFSKTISGHDDHPEDLLHKIVRAHGNTTEYAAFLAVLILWLGSHNPAPWVVWTMIATTACRYLLVAGLVGARTMARPNPVRFIGAAGTYVTGCMLLFALVKTL